MSKKEKQSFFTLKGKSIKSNEMTIASSFKDLSRNYTALIKENVASIAFDETFQLYDDYEPNFSDAFAYKYQKVKKWLNNKNINNKVIRNTWIAGSFLSFCFVAVVFAFYPMKVMPAISHKYSIYAGTPLQLGSTTYQIYSKDARSQKINMVFREFNCPLEGMGEVFVYEADKHSIPWWLVAAVSFQESSCGKMTPEPGGLESYNAWGWAVYGDNVQTFDNWARGIETVSEYMSNKFISKGIVEPCDIMKVYTPPSKGSWCEGVKYFGDMIQNYNTPEI